MCGAGGGEGRDNSSESLCSCFIFAGHLGEAGRNTAGRVIRRLSGRGWEEARAAEGGVKALSTSLDGHQPDVQTIWSRAGGGCGVRREGQNAGKWLGRVPAAGDEGRHLGWPARCHRRGKWEAFPCLL